MKDENREKIIETIRKLKTLSVEGASEGEKSAAKSKLLLLLNKYNISEDDIERRERTAYPFRIRDKWDFEVLKQCYAFLFNETSFHHHRTDDKYIINVEATQYEFFELNLFFDYYKLAWAEEQKNLWIAFYHKHRLAKVEPVQAPPSNIDPEDNERIQRMINSITTPTLLRPLGYLEENQG